ncbi:MAG: ACT domain-containing protein [Chloroflexota bacterium]|nr:ACT domain-containing protein [Chloroflexota bacterium]
MTHSLNLSILPGAFAICRLDADAPIPSWVTTRDFVSITRTRDELSIVCVQRDVPDGVQGERGWRALRVETKLDFALTGILASLAAPLADAGISIFAISTFDTDYLLVKETDLPRVVQVLSAAGHKINWTLTNTDKH